MFLLEFHFWPWLQGLDENLFRLINSKWTNNIFDSIMPFVRNSYHWYPLYIFLIVFVPLNFKKNGWWWVLAAILTISITDAGGTYLFKHNFDRIRPCKDPAMQEYLRLLTGCSSGQSFISNHAANHFGMAAFWFFTLRKPVGWLLWLSFAWAALIAYAQVYVGVHYPLDIFFGALWGLMAGSATAILFKKYAGSLQQSG